MTLITSIILGAVLLLLGLGLGYYLRVIVALGKRRSIEIDIKDMMLGAKEEAQRLQDEAKKRSEEILKKAKEDEEKREQEFREKEKRLMKKDELLDARQGDIDKEVESIKQKVEDIKKIQEKVAKALEEKLVELERVSRLSQEEAREELFRDVEKKYEEDLLVRMMKLENNNEEKLSRRAKDILA
ncbi:MAG: Rnase Y domain-containing protein, partial [Candidatus Paceibacterota bacterium]